MLVNTVNSCQIPISPASKSKDHIDTSSIFRVFHFQAMIWICFNHDFPENPKATTPFCLLRKHPKTPHGPPHASASQDGVAALELLFQHRVDSSGLNGKIDFEKAGIIEVASPHIDQEVEVQMERERERLQL